MARGGGRSIAERLDAESDEEDEEMPDNAYFM
jgi:hypothetical protein